MAHYQNDPRPPAQDGAAGAEHLRYLLTAYLFGNISGAGRREVEEHLAGCAACREALEELRRTLALVEEAVEADRREYVFEERRRGRVLVAAKNARHDWLGRLSPFAVPRVSWRFGAAAAVLLVVLVGGLLLPLLARGRSSREDVLRSPPRPAAKTAEGPWLQHDYRSEKSKQVLPLADEDLASSERETLPPLTAGERGEVVRKRVDEAKPAAPESRSEVVKRFVEEADEARTAGTTLRTAQGLKRVPAEAEKAAAAPAETPPTDPTSTVDSGVVVPKDILEKAELGDRFETVNPDRPETRSAFGNPDAHFFADKEAGKEMAQGRDNAREAALEEAIAAGGGGTPGTGGGLGGGAGRGVAAFAKKQPTSTPATPAPTAKPTPAPQTVVGKETREPAGKVAFEIKNTGTVYQADQLTGATAQASPAAGEKKGQRALKLLFDDYVKDHRTFAAPSADEKAKGKPGDAKDNSWIQGTTQDVDDFKLVRPSEEHAAINVNSAENLAVVPDKLVGATGKPVEVPDAKKESAPVRHPVAAPREPLKGYVATTDAETLSPYQDSGKTGKESLADLKVSVNELRGKDLQRQGESGLKVAQDGSSSQSQPYRWQFTGEKEKQAVAACKSFAEVEDVYRRTEWDRDSFESRGGRKPTIVDYDISGSSYDPVMRGLTPEEAARVREKPAQELLKSRTGEAEKDSFLAAFNGDVDPATEVSGTRRVAAKTPSGPAEKPLESEAQTRAVDTTGLLGVLNDPAVLVAEDARRQGFRYNPKHSSELSVTGWANAARKAATTADPATVEKALRWLAEHQKPDGSWETSGLGGQDKDEKAETNLALMAFLGGGHGEATGRYAENVRRAQDWLKTRQRGADEHTFRAFRYFRAENEKLAYPEFVRRPLPVPAPELTDEGMDEDAFIERYGYRPFVDAARDHLSTFGMDVDTASYTQARAALREGRLPEPESVRTEEFVNYFKQPYEVAGDETFGVFAEGMPSPFGCAAGLELVKIGIKSREPRPDERKPAVLTFVVDTSGSMGREDEHGLSRLDLLREALRSLVASLSAEDSICIVGFGDQAEVLLPRTQARFASRILDGLNRLSAGGGTNLEAGLDLGYRLADEAYSPEAVNRVVLCSDGVANVGQQGPDELLKLVQVFAARGIDLAAVGLGLGQFNDAMMQKLADSGNGSAHFVDTPREAEKVFREQLPPHLGALARDAKVQVDFNPEVVARYRLLGYEKRKIADKDFRNDKIDAGEVGHATLVTVLYEIQRCPNANGPLGKIYLRWKDASRRHLPVVERNFPLGEGLIAARVEAAPADLRFLACVAQFAELLRGNRWAQTGSFAAVLGQLEQLPDEYRSRAEWNELTELVRRAQGLSVQCWAEEARAQGKR